jgi:hypothetical protein
MYMSIKRGERTFSFYVVYFGINIQQLLQKFEFLLYFLKLVDL